MIHKPAKDTIKFMEKAGTQINNLEIKFMELKTDIGYIKDSLKNNDSQHKEILSKIDHLGDSFQGKIQDKADQKEVMEKFNCLNETYVSLEAFQPIQKFFWGLVGAVGLAIIGAIIDLILK